MIKISDFGYELPKELIANRPAEPRDSCRLMVVDRKTGEINHRIFSDLIEFLGPDDVLVMNQTKVFPARVFGKKETGGKVEVLLLKQVGDGEWEAIGKPGLKVGATVKFNFGVNGVVLRPDSASGLRNDLADGVIRVRFSVGGQEFWRWLDKVGKTPLPPYIKSVDDEKTLRQEYQTVYAKEVGSAAAPTAGMHFTAELLGKLQNIGVQLEYLTLHVGLGTFRPVKEENLTSGKLHEEYFELTKETAERLSRAKAEGKRIIAVGTTTCRVLESVASGLSDSGADARKPYFIFFQTQLAETSLKQMKKNNKASLRRTAITGSMQAEQIALLRCATIRNTTDIFIYPPYQFKFVDSLITNFHLPESSLLMLVSALVSKPNTTREFVDFGKSLIGEAYNEAVKNKYRFFSFGDAMIIR